MTSVSPTTRDQVRDILNQRSRSLLAGNHLEALRLTYDLVDTLASMGCIAPAFEPIIHVNGEARYFAGFRPDGSAVYSANVDAMLYSWHLFPAPNAWAQRSHTTVDRLAMEQAVEAVLHQFNDGFGHCDDLLGSVLERFSHPLDPCAVRAIA